MRIFDFTFFFFYISTLTYGDELWVVTERMKSQTQAVEMRVPSQGGLAQSRAAAPLCRKGWVHVVCESNQCVSWASSFGFSGHN